MKFKLGTFVATLALATVIGCGGPKPALISSADISQAEKDGSLIALYDKATGLIKESRGSTKKELVEIQAGLSKKIVANRTQLTEQTLAQVNEFGLVSLDKLAPVVTKVEDLSRVDKPAYDLLMPQIKEAKELTSNAVSESVQMSERTAKDIVERFKWLRKSALLQGESSVAYSDYQNNLQKSVAQLVKQGREAYTKRMFNLSLSSAQKGLAIDPGNLQLESMLSQSEASLFEQNFRSALENGKPELAYQSLKEVSNKPIMLQITKKMERPILLLANYFASNAQASYQKGNLYRAYSEFKRGRDVQKMASQTNIGFVQERRFLDILMAKYTSEATNQGLKLGLLKVIKEFDDKYATLSEQNQLQTEKLVNRATTKLSVASFDEVLSSNSVVASLGRRVGSKLEKILFDQLGKQLQIVTDTSSLTSQTPYSGVSLLVDGEVLQAAVETSRNQGQRSINVQTGLNRTEREEYTKWKKRKRGEAPVQYDEEKVMEDVVINVEHIRKIAVAEVAYRIVEPTTQKVLFTNNIVKESKHQGDSTNEFQKGLFHQKYVEADLPSDIKIMDTLATELSNELGKSLLTFLAKPEQSFYSGYQSALEKGQQAQAIEMLSNAVVISPPESETLEEWVAQLIKLTLEQ